MLEVATIQSTRASNRIEGIFTSDKRLKDLMDSKSEPKNRNEQEIMGYRNVLSTIHESYEFISFNPNIILQMHRDLYSSSNPSFGGKYKEPDNIIAQSDSKGHSFVRFKPVPSYQTPEAMENMCNAYKEAKQKTEINDLILIPMVILDFLCIHPFNDGNGRISRLLTTLLYYKSNYIVGKYISIEKLIEENKESYYETLKMCSNNWMDNNNQYESFINFYIGITTKAYNEFENRIEYLFTKKLSKPKQIKSFIDKNIGKINKREIMETLPNISKVTVERTLTDLVKTGYINKIGAGKLTSYIKAPKKD